MEVMSCDVELCHHSMLDIGLDIRMSHCKRVKRPCDYFSPSRKH